MSANEYLDIAPEVLQALQDRQAVVALESTIISHGMPHPQNIETALQAEAAVRENGAIPATIALLDGRLKAGLSRAEIEGLGERGQRTIKASRRDIAFIVARRESAATTVAATMIIADMAGIRVFATGGIGGVHRGVENTMDISADLQELSRSDIAVVCAGVKSVLDIGRTLEYLETTGVPVVGFRTNNLPAFYTPDSGFPVDYRVESAAQVAAAMKAKWDMRLHGGMVIGNPISAQHALDPREINELIDKTIVEMHDNGISGKDTTPFLLQRIAERTEGRSLQANIQLMLSNAGLAAQVAAEFIKLQ